MEYHKDEEILLPRKSMKIYDYTFANALGL